MTSTRTDEHRRSSNSPGGMIEMFSTHLNTVLQTMTSDRRQWSEQGSRASRRSAAVAFRGVPEPGPVPEARTVSVASARTTARRRWFWRTDRQVATTAAPAPIEYTWANRVPGTAGFARWAAAAGQRIADQGITVATRDIDNMVDAARRTGVAQVAAGVLADTDASEQVRLRAFAVVMSALVGFGSGPSRTR